MIIFYSTNCPKCKVLETKLKAKNIEFTTCSNMDEMLSKGIKSAPVLELEDNTILNFTDAVRWVNNK